MQHDSYHYVHLVVVVIVVEKWPHLDLDEQEAHGDQEACRELCCCPRLNCTQVSSALCGRARHKIDRR